MFRDIKRGDKVWTPLFGWGVVSDVGESYAYQILVTSIDGTNQARFRYDGSFCRDNSQCLFWDEIPMTPPPRPKRKVKKVVEGWLNIFGPGQTECYLHPTKPGADDSIINTGKKRLGDAAYVRHEFEVEE